MYECVSKGIYLCVLILVFCCHKERNTGGELLTKIYSEYQFYDRDTHHNVDFVNNVVCNSNAILSAFHNISWKLSERNRLHALLGKRRHITVYVITIKIQQTHTNNSLLDEKRDVHLTWRRRASLAWLASAPDVWRSPSRWPAPDRHRSRLTSPRSPDCLGNTNTKHHTCYRRGLNVSTVKAPQRHEDDGTHDATTTTTVLSSPSLPCQEGSSPM